MLVRWIMIACISADIRGTSVCCVCEGVIERVCCYLTNFTYTHMTRCSIQVTTEK